MGKIFKMLGLVYFTLLYFDSKAQWESTIQSPHRVASAGMSFIPNSPIVQFANPAALALQTKKTAFVNSLYLFGLSDIKYLNAGTNLKLKNNRLGIGLNYLSHGNYTETKLNTAFSLQIAKHFYAGLGLSGDFLILENNYRTQRLHSNLAVVYVYRKVDFSVGINNVFRAKFNNLAIANTPNSSGIFSARVRFNKQTNFTAEAAMSDVEPIIFRGSLSHKLHPTINLIVGVSNRNIPFSMGTFYTRNNVKVGIGMGVTKFGIISSGGISYAW